MLTASDASLKSLKQSEKARRPRVPAISGKGAGEILIQKQQQLGSSDEGSPRCRNMAFLRSEGGSSNSVLGSGGRGFPSLSATPTPSCSHHQPVGTNHHVISRFQSARRR
ncbi:hypothetical protein NDU88_002018 [Pleurodeles waltl]|uniref:Uncharacterized protein n=1 Tax=Pleurodeles waltl TaxID=8319 RepID=A0AAV7UUE0_PLEWA|nr:hypothetical protein NDU88_002018 [Pleurodeles waltl]